MKKKKILAMLLVFMLAFSGCSSKKEEDSTTTEATTTQEATTEATTTEATTEEEKKNYAGMTAEEIVAELTIEEKINQMLLPAIYNIQEGDMKENCYGGILSKMLPETYKKWQSLVDRYQEAALRSDTGIPYIYGQDDVHGVNYCSGAVIFPHNIGIGAANNEELTYQMGLATADEALLCHMIWNYAPCVAQATEPRWGRTYESYGTNLDIITKLAVAYTKGLVDGGVIACPKHFFADGNVEYGSGEDSDADRITDRGNANLSEEEISALLKVYEELINAGAQTIMLSHSSVNGVKMHENKQYVDYLKNDLNFEGFVVSDWNSIQNTSATTYKEQLINCINAGVDMLMEVDDFEEAFGLIMEAVEEGKISEARIDDAVTRILRVKINAGVIDDPYFEKVVTKQSATGSDEYRDLAEQLVEESLVLLKNEGDVLPFKEGTSIYITGPAANNDVSQCGGWTLDWNESMYENIPGLTTILEGFEEKAAEYGITIITDKEQAKDADVVLLVVGERSYAEWLGDTEDLELCGDMGLDGNLEAIEEAKSLGKPVVTCIVAGRQVIIDEYYDDWDAVVMCYLPGSEGQGVADVLCGGTDFKGKLPSPWYNSVGQIKTDNCWLPEGYGLNYGY